MTININWIKQNTASNYFSDKKKVASSGYGPSKRPSSVPPKRPENADSEHSNLTANPVNNLTRTQSYSDVRISRFKKSAKKVQTTCTITKMFHDKKNTLSTGYVQRKRESSAPPKLSENSESGNSNLTLNWVNNLPKAQSYTDVRESRFKRSVRKVQTAAAVTKLFSDNKNSKKVLSSGYGQSTKPSKADAKLVEDTESENLENKYNNPMLNYVNSLTKIPSYSDVKASRFKRTAIKIQSTSAVTRMFNEAGQVKHGTHCKSLYQ